MSLAMFAAPVENDDDDDTMVNQKKRHNKTQRKYESSLPKPLSSSEKVNSVLATINESMSNIEDSGLADFKPLPPPVSIGASRAKTNEDRKKHQMSFENNEPLSYENGENIQRDNPIVDRFRTMGRTPQSGNTNSSLDLNYLDSNYIDDRNAQEYYNKFLPSVSPQQSQGRMQAAQLNKRFQSTLNNMNRNFNENTDGTSHDVLMQKINYMIHLLEEQQDERVNNVGEEVVLYSFLGIFMIFLVDSFVRVGKYVR